MASLRALRPGPPGPPALDPAMRALHIAMGRGADLLSCGDVEANPGPIEEDGLAMAVDVDAMVTALCSDVSGEGTLTTAALNLTGTGDTVSAFPPGVMAPPPIQMGLPPPQPPLPTARPTPLDQAAPVLDPSWDEIAQDDRSTILHIPRGAVEAVTRTFVEVLPRYLSEGSWESFHALWPFPKAVLAPLSRGGRTH